jgi:hypothetical protein
MVKYSNDEKISLSELWWIYMFSAPLNMKSESRLSVCRCMCMCMYVCAYEHLCVNIFIYLFIHIWTRALLARLTG